MRHLNYEFFDEFKNLDILCRDIYGKSVDNKLGVTLYLEDMDSKHSQGSLKVMGWTADYNRLKSVRHIRNELAHSRNSFSYDICSQDDIDFVRSFRARIVNQTDPISQLKKQMIRHRQSYISSNAQHRQAFSYNTPQRASSGCLGGIVAFLLAIACIIAFLI